jgi:hypothetical protein
LATTAPVATAMMATSPRESCPSATDGGEVVVTRSGYRVLPAALSGLLSAGQAAPTGAVRGVLGV